MIKFLIFALIFGVTAISAVASECPLPKGLGLILNPVGKPIYRVKSNGDTYTYWDVQNKNKNAYFVTVIRQDSRRACYLAFTDPLGEGASMTSGVPKSIAITFEKQFVETALKKRGKAEIQKDILSLSTMTAEEADAYKLLGFSLPPTVKIAPYNFGKLHQRKYK